MNNSPHPAAAATPPTRVRHLVVGLTTAMAVLLYLDRICLSITERYIKEDMRLSNAQVAGLLSAFFWTYAIAQVPGGWLSDRFGARRMLALYIVLWSLFTGLMGVAHSFVALLLFRFGCGLAQAGAYPTSANLLSKWVPFAARGWASGVVSTGGRLGGFAAPVLTAYLMVAFVPLETSSRLLPEDLLDGPGLCVRLGHQGDTPPDRLAAAIREGLPSATRQMVEQCAKESGNDHTSTGQASLLLAGLNEVLEWRDLIAAVNLDEFPLPTEARRLAVLPDDRLTEQQIERRNRLLLEAAYPDEIRKVYGSGWRPVMLVYGVAGLLVAGLFWLVVRDRPQDHPACNAAEVARIESDRPATATTPHGRVGGLPLHAMLRSRGLWLSSMSQFCTNFAWVFLLTWFPRYLGDVHHVPVLERGWLASMPLLWGMGGMLAGGWLVDRLTRGLGLRWGRGLPMIVTRFLAMAAFIACVFLDSPAAVTAALCVVAIATDLGTPAAWAFMQDVGGKHVGSVLGWGNMWGNIGAALSPLVLNAVIGPAPGHWNACFLTCAGAFLLAGVAAIGVDATIPITPPDQGRGELSG